MAVLCSAELFLFLFFFFVFTWSEIVAMRCVRCFSFLFHIHFTTNIPTNILGRTIIFAHGHKIYSKLVFSHIALLFSRSPDFPKMNYFHLALCTIPLEFQVLNAHTHTHVSTHARTQTNKSKEKSVQSCTFYFIHINFLINYGHSLPYNSLYRQFGVFKQFISSHSIYDDLLKVWHWVIFFFLLSGSFEPVINVIAVIVYNFSIHKSFASNQILIGFTIAFIFWKAEKCALLT